MKEAIENQPLPYRLASVEEVDWEVWTKNHIKMNYLIHD